METITLEITEDQAAQLESTANSVGIPKEELLKAGLADILGGTSEEFQNIAESIVRDNQELYQRLS